MISAGPQRDLNKSALMWVPSRHQLADGFTKSGLGDLVRTLMTTGTCQFHEESAQALRRKAKASKAEKDSEMGNEFGYTGVKIEKNHGKMEIKARTSSTKSGPRLRRWSCKASCQDYL